MFGLIWTIVAILLIFWGVGLVARLVSRLMLRPPS